MNKEEIEKIVDLFDKGYCNECNELNCLGGMPSSRKVADAIKNLQSQLTKSNNKIEKIKEYITSYESISLIQGLDDIDKNKDLDKNTMIEMTNRYLMVHDNILSIIDGSDE